MDKCFIESFKGAGCCFGWEGAVGDPEDADDAFTRGPANIFYT